MGTKPIVRELQVNGKRYFHLTCECRDKPNGVFYSVVHEWEHLNEWLKRLEENHDCDKA